MFNYTCLSSKLTAGSADTYKTTYHYKPDTAFYKCTHKPALSTDLSIVTQCKTYLDEASCGNDSNCNWI